MIAEEASASAEFTAIDAKSINESLAMGDAPAPRLFGYPENSESLVIADAPAPALSFTISDLIFIWDTLIHGWKVTADESLVLTDSLSEVLGLMISDWITLVDTQTNNWNGRDIINDTLNLYDVAQGVKRFSDTISESLDIADTANYALTVTVLEYLGFTSLAAAMKTMAQSVNENIALADSSEAAFALLIEETLSAVDAATVIGTFIGNIIDSLVLAGAPTDTIVGFMETIQEALGISDVASYLKMLGISVDESLAFSETISSQGTLYSAIYDTLKMNATVELSGEVYECYALNTPKFMPSMYSGFDFNSYCVFENRAFGANDTGIYELTGETDAGSTIHDGVILSSTDFGSRNQKKFRRAYLGISGSSPVMVVETEEGERRVYNIDTKGKAVISHELKSKKWKLSVADFDEFNTMKLIPVILSK
jgi:hypothetical protein